MPKTFLSKAKKNKIFVGGFPVHLNDGDLEAYMSKFGKVLSTKILMKKGRSRGFGFVTFEDFKVANYVIQLVHKIEGRNVR